MAAYRLGVRGDPPLMKEVAVGGSRRTHALGELELSLAHWAFFLSEPGAESGKAVSHAAPKRRHFLRLRSPGTS